ncbi:hypothetical protein RJT34_30881 [Clitoria ternatea]|uniref:Uncharacterized protein n=1 Tax=Clitoria ternatea TaxID=43366 RepID=A0AAN9ET97_CLITE
MMPSSFCFQCQIKKLERTRLLFCINHLLFFKCNLNPFIEAIIYHFLSMSSKLSSLVLTFILIRVHLTCVTLYLIRN